MDLEKWGVLKDLDHNFRKAVKSVFIYGLEGKEVLIKTFDDTIYALGTNRDSCLALPSNIVPGGVPYPVNALLSLDIEQISAGWCDFRSPSGSVHRTHVAILTTSGKIYTFGSNIVGQLGCDQRIASKDLHKVQDGLNQKFVQVACGNAFCLAINKKGEICSWGDNSFGQCGQGDRKKKTCSVGVVIVEASKETKFQAVTCGINASFAITENGHVYAWGSNSYNKLGIEDQQQCLNPTIITGLLDYSIEKVVCGMRHTLALSKDGEVFAWGSNNRGELGNGEQNDNCVKTPLRTVKEIGFVVDIACVPYCSISVAQVIQDKIYTWGRCNGKVILAPSLTTYKQMEEVFASESCPAITSTFIDVEGNKALSMLKNSFNNPDESDLKVIVDNREIYVHKTILKIRSEPFCKMLGSNWKEGNSNEIRLDRFSYETYKSFLYYLYTDEVYVHPDSVSELLILADMYIENTLKKKCLSMAKDLITRDTVLKMYQFAVANVVSELEEVCAEFVSKNFNKIILSPEFSAMDADLARHLIITSTQKKGKQDEGDDDSEESNESDDSNELSLLKRFQNY